MNFQTFSKTLRTTTLTTLCALAPAAVFAQQAGTPNYSKSATVSLAGLNLNTPEGVAGARERLHQSARVLCNRVADSLDLSHQANFVKCVDETVANAIKQVQAKAFAAQRSSGGAPVAKATGSTPSGDAPVTRSAKVSLDGLDLATPDGARAAHERLHEAARIACSRAADSLDLSHQANFVVCVDETMAATLRAIREPVVANGGPSASASQSISQ